MLKLDLTKKALGFFEQLPPKQFRQVANKVFSLMENPLPYDLKELVGYPFRRADIGEYRIVYRVEGDILKVALIGKRNDDDVYRQLKR
ncbi:MAG: type II toxin-antitoxin system RelE/ParE family toxin [Desulfobulbaceae bacterium]|nr:type II toxin-antitoxin system RelE/ParE family toxin [Desulfobulbaceae bacterium]HIJ89296.1 type II toxin-antitoxin system RelE/ParE family toxin [Deltaproteobacteria bacterium]